jgi:hypothetical protein
MTETQKPIREPLPRGFWIIWSTVALDMIGFGMVAPILGRYADRFGANGFQVGMLFASFSLVQQVHSGCCLQADSSTAHRVPASQLHKVR